MANHTTPETAWPVLSLDRIYTRHLEILDARLHSGEPWLYLSDHLPLSATVRPR